METTQNVKKRFISWVRFYLLEEIIASETTVSL